VVQQRQFVRLVAKLIEYATDHGWEFSFGETYRSDGNGHIKNSLHYQRLAIDLNLFIDGVYITGEDPAWYSLGDYWKSLDPLCRWGGDIKGKRDFNHFSYAVDFNDNRI
jgi:hypothetical protein